MGVRWESGEWRERERVCVCVGERVWDVRESGGREKERVRWECGKIGRWEWGMWFEGKGKMVGWEREPEWGDSKVVRREGGWG